MNEVQASFAEVYETAFSQCIRSGVTPNELWLGPDMFEMIRWEVNYLSPASGVLATSGGCGSYEGLTIRLMKSDGLRVGRSFGVEGEKI